MWPSAAEASRAITLVVPFAPGGVVDLMGQGLRDAVRPHLAVPVLLDYRPGGDGTLGIAEVLRADADGYTIGLAAVAILAVQPHLASLPYRSPADCTPIIKVTSLPTVVAVRAGASWPSMTTLLEEARQRPGSVRAGLGGIGRISHLNLAELMSLAGARVAEVPYEGPKQVQALLDGEVDLAVANQNAVLKEARAGRLRVLCVFHPVRTPQFPDAPTAPELGYDVALGLYHFLVAPRATPASIVRGLHDAFRRALGEPSFAALAGEHGFAIDYQGPEALAADLADLFDRYGRMIRTLGLRRPA